MSEILENLFRSKAEVKLLRLFLNNPDAEFLSSEISSSSKIRTTVARQEIKSLLKIKFLLQRKKSGKVYYRANKNFIFFDELRRLIFKASPTSSDKVAARVEKLGKIRFVLVSGVFLNYSKGKIDILIVGEHINRGKLKTFLSNVEAEVGKEVNYVCMSTDEFRYRKGMFDKFVINIFECPHKILIDKMKTEV